MDGLKIELKALRGETMNVIAGIDRIIKDYATPLLLDNTLNVPWLSQLGLDANFAPGDCGPACLAMWLRYLGHNDVTVDDVSEASGRPPGYRYTLPAHLYYTARGWGVNLYWARDLSLDHIRAEIDAGQPVIVLGHYGALPKHLRYDPRYKAGHWFLIVGYDDETVTYLDPYWLENGRKTMTWQEFYHVWDSNHHDGNSDCQALRLRR